MSHKRRIEALEQAIAARMNRAIDTSLEQAFDVLEAALPLEVYTAALDAIAAAPDETLAVTRPTAAAVVAAELARLRVLLRGALPESWADVAIAAIDGQAITHGR